MSLKNVLIYFLDFVDEFCGPQKWICWFLLNKMVDGTGF